jgi:hypothetical protein
LASNLCQKNPEPSPQLTNIGPGQKVNNLLKHKFMLKNSFKIVLLGYLMHFTYNTAKAQTTSIDAEIRPRTEFRQGFQKPLLDVDSTQSAFITYQRSRLNADYKGKVLNARMCLQDSRIWGNSNTKTSDSKLELFEGWAEYLMTTGLSVQIGRQVLKYDDQRLLAASNWSNTGIAHDALVMKLKDPFMTAHLGLAYNNSSDALYNANYLYYNKVYRTMGYLWASKDLYSGLTLSIIGICEGFQRPKPYYNTLYPRATMGGNLVFLSDSSKLAFTLTGYVQAGKDPNVIYNSDRYAKLVAHFFAAKVQYNVLSSLSVNIGLDYYSGTSGLTNVSNKSSISRTFNKLYGSNHSFNGFMEYFSAVPAAGLADYYGGAFYKVTPRLSADVAYHIFNLAQGAKYQKNSTSAAIDINKNLGSELDFTFNFAVCKEVTLQAGYSRYFNSGSTKNYFKMDTGSSIQPQQWAYVMLTVKPLFYKTPIPGSTDK